MLDDLADRGLLCKDNKKKKIYWVLQEEDATATATAEDSGKSWTCAMPECRPRHADLLHNTAQCVVEVQVCLKQCAVVAPLIFNITVRYLLSCHVER